MLLEATVGADDDGRRLDRVLRKALVHLPLSAIHRLLRKGRVCLDGIAASGTVRVRAGSILRVESDLSIPENRGNEVFSKRRDTQGGSKIHPNHAVPRFPEVLWEGAGLLGLNKEAGTAVHGPCSLEGAVLSYLSNPMETSLSFKPGPLHRLDRPTSGLVFFSTNLRGAQNFSQALRERRLGKRYLAVLEGPLEQKEYWDDKLIRNRRSRRTEVLEGTLMQGQNSGGEIALRAETAFIPLASRGGFTLTLVEIGTGRTHQIRAQAAAHGHPLAGDRKYGGVARWARFFLHSYEMNFSSAPELSLPDSLRAPLPREFLEAITTTFGSKIECFLERMPPTEELLSGIL